MAIDAAQKPRGINREPVPLAYNERPWLKARFATSGDMPVSLSAANAYLWQRNLPAKTINRIVVPVNPSYEAAFKFYAKGVDNAEFTGFVWGLKALQDGANVEYLGDPLLAMTFNLGTGAVNGSDILPNATKAVEVITVTEDYTIEPGYFFVGADHENTGTPALNSWLTLVIDRAPGYSWFVVELLPNTATNAGFLYLA